MWDLLYIFFSCFAPLWATTVWLLELPAFIRRFVASLGTSPLRAVGYLVIFVFSPFTIPFAILSRVLLPLIPIFLSILTLIAIIPTLVLGGLMYLLPSRSLREIWQAFVDWWLEQGEATLESTPGFAVQVGRRLLRFVKFLKGKILQVLKRNPRYAIPILRWSWMVRRLQALGLEREAISVLFTFASDPNLKTQIHLKALNAMNRYPCNEDLSLLAGSAKVPLMARRQAARMLLARDTTSLAAEAWQSLAYIPGADSLSLEAAQSLMRLGRLEEAAAALGALVANTRAIHTIRVQAAKILGERFDRASVEPVLKRVAQNKDETPELRLQAAAVLANFNYIEQAAPVLIALARNANIRLSQQRMAVQILGEIGQVDTLCGLAEASDLAPRVRFEAIRALGRLGLTEEAANLSLQLAQDSRIPDDVHLMAAEMAGQQGRSEARRLLLDFGIDKSISPTLRLKAATALEDLGWSDEARKIYLALDNPRNGGELVRRAVRQALEQ
jgi:HEAT repeat protein